MLKYYIAGLVVTNINVLYTRDSLGLSFMTLILNLLRKTLRSLLLALLNQKTTLWTHCWHSWVNSFEPVCWLCWDNALEPVVDSAETSLWSLLADYADTTMLRLLLTLLRQPWSLFLTLQRQPCRACYWLYWDIPVEPVVTLQRKPCGAYCCWLCWDNPVEHVAGSTENIPVEPVDNSAETTLWRLLLTLLRQRRGACCWLCGGNLWILLLTLLRQPCGACYWLCWDNHVKTIANSAACC